VRGHRPGERVAEDVLGGEGLDGGGASYVVDEEVVGDLWTFFFEVFGVFFFR